jgi:hypothetical protein
MDIPGIGIAGTGNALAALLFMTSAMTTLDAYSTLLSSPWTAENFGADPEKANSCKEYLTHAVVFSMIYAAASAYIAHSWWPIIGAAIANMYLVWLYRRGLARGKVSGSTGWAKA